MTDTPTADDLARWAALADVHVQRETITGFLPQCRCGGLWPCATGEALSGLLALVAAQAEQIARVRAVLAHSALVSPSPAMTVYAAEIRAALDTPPPS